MRSKLEEREREAAMAAAAAAMRRQRDSAAGMTAQANSDRLTALRMDGARLQQRVADMIRAKKSSNIGSKTDMSSRKRPYPGGGESVGRTGRGGTVRVTWTSGNYSQESLSSLLYKYGGSIPSIIMRTDKNLALAEYPPPGDAMTAIDNAATEGLVDLVLLSYTE